MSEEIIQLEKNLKEYIKESGADIKDDCDKTYMTKEAILDRLGNYVKFSTFTYILGILMVIVVGLFGVIYAKLEIVDSNTQESQQELSELNGRLEPFEFITESYE